MEISSLSSNSYYISSLASSSRTSLTDEQKETVAEIISQYDTEKMTTPQYQELMDQLKDANIKMTDEVKSFLEEAGIEVPDSTTLTEIQNSRSASLLDYLGDDHDNDHNSLLLSSKVSQLLSQYQSGDITEDDLFSSLKAMSSDSTSSVGNFVDLEA